MNTLINPVVNYSEIKSMNGKVYYYESYTHMIRFRDTI